MPRNSEAQAKQREVGKPLGRNKVLDKLLLFTVLCREDALSPFGQVFMDSGDTLLKLEDTTLETSSGTLIPEIRTRWWHPGPRGS